MSYRDVEELLAERGIDVSYETVRRWALKFGAEYARRIKKRRPLPHIEGFAINRNGGMEIGDPSRLIGQFKENVSPSKS